MAVASQDILEEVAGFLDFRTGDAQVLADIAPLVRPYFPAIVEHFYDAIQHNEGASAVITGGQAQIDRLKATLQDWLEGLVGGVYDAAYLERRSRIGHVHVRIGLDQRYMFSAMNVLRIGLHDALDRALDELPPASRWNVERARAAHRAIDKICDIELAVMLETYREDYTARIRNTERLAVIGQFAASIGHELRNPLAVLETSLHLLRKRIGDDAKALRHVERIGDQATLCGNIITDLLELARDRNPEFETIEIAHLMRQGVDGLPAREGARVETLVEDDLPAVEVDVTQIRQLVANLVMNAMQAVTQGQRTGHVTARGWVEGDALRIRVEDDGPGLSEEVKAHLFEPLFTTRSKGIGLGLALCRRVTEKHGGTISGENRSEGGAVFDVWLPGVVRGSS